MTELHSTTVGSWLARGWNAFKWKPKPIIGGTSIFYGFLFAPVLINYFVGKFWVGILFQFLVIPVLTVGWYHLCLRLIRGDDVRSLDVFSGFTRFRTAWVTNFILSLIVFGGFILFLVPGVIWTLKYSFSLFAIMDKPLSPQEAIRFSGRITKGHKGKLFLVALIAILVPCLLDLLLWSFYSRLRLPVDGFDPFLLALVSVPSVLIAPLLGATFAASYDSLALEEDLEIMESKRTSALKKGLAVVGLVAAIIVGILGVIIWTKVSFGIDELKKEIASGFADEVSRVQASDFVTAEEVAVLHELAEISTNRETSFFGVMVSWSVVKKAIEDEQITEQESEAIYLVRHLLKERNGQIGFFDIVIFIKDNPPVKKIFDEWKKKQKPVHHNTSTGGSSEKQMP